MEAYGSLEDRVADAERGTALAAAARYAFDSVDREGGLALIRSALERTSRRYAEMEGR